MQDHNVKAVQSKTFSNFIQAKVHTYSKGCIIRNAFEISKCITIPDMCRNDFILKSLVDDEVGTGN